MLVREIAGGGYLASIPVVGFAVLGLGRGRLRGSKRRLLLCIIVAPAALVLGANATSSYFIAIRQFLFILPGLVVAAVAGIEVTVSNLPALRSVLLPVVLASQAIPVFRSMYAKETEDWRAAAVKARSWLPAGQCVLRTWLSVRSVALSVMPSSGALGSMCWRRQKSEPPRRKNRV